MSKRRSYPPATMSDAQFEQLLSRLVLCTEQMTRNQVLELANALYAVSRTRRANRAVGSFIEIRA
jgi:hypothetical protein